MSLEEEYTLYTETLRPAIYKLLADGNQSDALVYIDTQMDEQKEAVLLPSLLGTQKSIALVNMRKLPEALEAARAAYNRLSDAPLDSTEVVRALGEAGNMVGETNERNGFRTEAIAFNLQMIDWLKQTDELNLGELTALLHSNQSRMLTLSGDLDGAQNHAEIALEIRKPLNNPFYLSTSYKNLGDIAVAQANQHNGDEKTKFLDVAQAYLEQSYDLRRKAYPDENHMKRAELEESLAYLAVARGDTEKATTHATTAYGMLLANRDTIKQAPALAERVRAQGIEIAPPQETQGALLYTPAQPPVSHGQNP